MTGEAGHVFSLSSGLAKRGHRVIIACRTRRKGQPIGIMLDRARELEGVEVVPLHLERGFSLKCDLADLGALDRLCGGLPDLRFVHAHRSKEHWLSLLLRRRHPQIRVVRTRHVVTHTRPHPFNRWLYRKTDAVLATSTAIRDGLTESRILLPEQITVLHGGVDAERFHPGVSGGQFREEIGVRSDTPVILAVGHLDHVKGYDVLISAFAQIHKTFPEARLVIVGSDGSLQRQDLLNQAIEQGLGENVILPGRREDIPDIMAACDIGVVSSIGSEGNSRVALEFLASGKPLIATKVGCLPDLIEHGKTGLLVAPGDAEALAREAIALLPHRDYAQQLALEGRSLVECSYTDDIVAQRMEEIYFSLI
ncbi:MAG: glycosyltransferase family 4 protein [bacterium]